ATDGNGCTSAASAAVSETVKPLPPTRTVSAVGATTLCVGGSVLLTSSSASGNQWYQNGSAVAGATSNSYGATASGNYTVKATDGNGCTSAASAAVSVTVNPLPATAVISAGGATTFCAGGSVLLTSSSASGNQWYLNGTAIAGATSNSYSATASGNYTVKVTDGNGCTSGTSAAVSVTVNPLPATPTISAGGSTTFCAGSSVVLTSSSASGNRWYQGSSGTTTTPIGGATTSSYVPPTGTRGTFTYWVRVKIGTCSADSATATVIVN